MQTLFLAAVLALAWGDAGRGIESGVAAGGTGLDDAACDPVLGRILRIVSSLNRFRRAAENAAKLASQIEKGETPGVPPALQFSRADRALVEMLANLRGLRVPAAPDPGDPHYRVSAAELGSPNAKVRAKAIGRLRGFNVALREHVGDLARLVDTLGEIHSMAQRTLQATRILQRSFEQLHKSAAVRAFFRDTFAFAWLDLETIMSRIADIRDEAQRKQKLLDGTLQERRKELAAHTSWLQRR